MGQSTDVGLSLFITLFLQTALEIITILCYNNHKRTVGIYKETKQHENNRATAQWAQMWTDGKMLWVLRGKRADGHGSTVKIPVDVSDLHPSEIYWIRKEIFRGCKRALHRIRKAAWTENRHPLYDDYAADLYIRPRLRTRFPVGRIWVLYLFRRFSLF